MIGALATIATAMPAAATDLAEFGRCLQGKGATFYGASWCPHCQAQKQTLGSAFSSIRYVECAPGGSRSETSSACRDANVSSYPTWVFGDGSRESGALSIGALAKKTGCPNPYSSGASGRKGTQQKGTGPKIINIPPE
jgi:hypothetical protein